MMGQDNCLPTSLNCVEVKGMSGLSLPYIMRFFGHAGSVEDAKKVEDKVIVRFKHRSSLAKVRRFNGQVVDKQPIKIRDMTSQVLADEIPQRRKHNDLSTHSQPSRQDTIDDTLDVPYHWAQVLKILDIVSDPRAKWILHELFALELTQALHINFFKQNSRSSLNFLTIKQLFLNDKSSKGNSLSGENSTQKLEIYSRIPNNIQYEATYECYANNIEVQVRRRLSSFRQYGLGDQALNLYSILYRNALMISEECSLISSSAEPQGKKQFKKVQLQINTKNHIQISVQEWPNFFQRSQYRSIDHDHPSREIEVLSGSRFHENASSVTIYDVFRDGFDGTIDNNCVADIFHDLHPYFSPNYLLIRHINGRKILYIRLDFQLRIINANGETLSQADYDRLYHWSSCEGFNEVPAIQLCQHNLVLSSFDNPQKIFYLVTNYITYFCNQTESQQPTLNVFAVTNNPIAERKELLNEIFNRLSENEALRRCNCQFYFINIDSEEKFQQMKCKNFIEQYVDNLHTELNFDTAKFHARKLLQKHPEKFKEMRDPKQFAEQTLWGMYLLKSKRKVKKGQMSSVKIIQGK